SGSNRSTPPLAERPFAGFTTPYSSINSTKQEGRLLLAIQAIKNRDIGSISLTARTFNVPRTTLRRRIDRIQYRANSRANYSKLTKIEEKSLKKWVLSIDSRGSAPRPSMVREIVDLIL
ncbi:uncharacterized protein N7500_003432, partial [Penicillium coprophilum]|uniref:uncharacterized protein n=1 Tax=Penicillium coprophilum TaxID=36646 RepID=UPI0023A05044